MSVMSIGCGHTEDKRINPKAIARVFLLTRDETDMIDDFLTYHAGIFGYQNITVVDHGSSCPVVLRSLECAARRGSTIIRETRPFATARDFMTEHMRAARHTAEWLLPLETDEFVVCSKHTDRADNVLDVLEKISPDVSILNYGAVLASCPDSNIVAYTHPARSIVRFYDQGWDKLIVRGSAFECMTMWCHNADVNSGWRGTLLGLNLLHFHEGGPRRTVERARRVVDSCFMDTSLPVIQQLPRLDHLASQPIFCGHKVKQYAQHLRRHIVLLVIEALLPPGSQFDKELALYAEERCPHKPEVAVFDVADALGEANEAKGG